MSIVRSLISKGSIFSQTVFCPHESAKPVFSDSSSLKRAFAKLRFPDVLVLACLVRDNTGYRPP